MEESGKGNPRVLVRKHIDELLMLCVALFYGFSYSVQSMGAKYVEAFSFNAIKNLISFVSLLIIYIIRKKKSNNLKKAIKFGALIAIVLTLFSYLQQVVALENAPGKTGFITSMYIVEVPLLSFILFKKKVNPQVLISLIFAIAGLVLLCDLRNFTIKISDVLTLISSLCLCAQIVVVGKYCYDVDSIEFTMCTSLFVALFSIIGAFIAKESYNPYAYKQALYPLLYVGIVCAAIGVSMQAYAQKTLDETTTSLILSLESLFSVIAGYLLLDVTLSKKELIGCILMFIAVIMCVTADRKKEN